MLYIDALVYKSIPWLWLIFMERWKMFNDQRVSILQCLARQTRKRKRRRWLLLASQRRALVSWARDPGQEAILVEV